MNDFLEQKRNQIDAIDQKILILLKKRFSLMPEIVKYKIKHNMPIYQPEREQELLEKRLAIAKELNINENLVKDLFSLITKESKRIQEEQR